MLTLPIKRQWFDMIAAGIKKEEYRNNTPYYQTRLQRYLGKPVKVTFRNGYCTDSPKITKTVIPRIGAGRPEWGAVPGKEYIVLAIQ